MICYPDKCPLCESSLSMKHIEAGSPTFLFVCYNYEHYYHLQLFNDRIRPLDPIIIEHWKQDSIQVVCYFYKDYDRNVSYIRNKKITNVRIPPTKNIKQLIKHFDIII